LQWGLENLLRRGGFEDLTAFEGLDRVGGGVGEVHCERDDYHRLAGIRQIGQHSEQVGCHARIKGAGRLVEETGAQAATRKSSPDRHQSAAGGERTIGNNQ
jgi:hypothetical protein